MKLLNRAAIAATLAMATPVATYAAPAAPAANPQDAAQAYADAAKAAGLTCELGPMVMRNSTPQQDVVEFRCATADDGRIGVFAKGATPTATFYNCVTVKLALSGGCANTKETAAYPSIIADIKRFDTRSDCRPDGTRLMGVTSNRQAAYLEVSCEGMDMNGQVLLYDLRTLRPTALSDCAVAQRTTNPCRLSGAVVVQDAVPDNSMNARLGSAASELGGFVRPDTAMGGVTITAPGRAGQ